MDIRELASILDDVVDTSKAGTVEYYEEQIIKSLKSGNLEKSLTYNPLTPYEMGPAKEIYHNPYRTLADGSYAPHDVDHWVSQGKRASDYNEVREFLTDAGYYVKKSKEATDKMRALVGGGEIRKAALPVGTIHDWRGVKFQKMSDSPAVWQPVKEHKGMAIPDAPGSGKHIEIENHANRHHTLHGEKRKRDQMRAHTESAKKELLDQVSRAHESAFGKEHAAKFQEALKKQQSEEKVTQQKERAGKKRDDVKHILNEKIKRLGKGEGRQVELTKDEMASVLDSGKYALISAGRNPNHPKESGMDEKDKFFASRYSDLQGDLKEGGYAFTDVTGHYGGKERSYLVMVHDHDEKHLLELGEKYNQDSVILADGGKQKIHFTSGENKGMFHEGEGWKEAPKEKDNFSEVETADGHILKFKLNFDFAKLRRADQKKEKGKALAPDDEGKPSNNLKEREFQIPGSEVEPLHIQNFVTKFHPDFQKLMTMDEEVMSAGASHFASRLKDPSSLEGKMKGRLQNRSLNTVTDVIGSRALAETLKDQKSILNSVKKKYEIVELEDASEFPRRDGYRAVHILFKTPSGKIGELQIKTHNQQLFAGYTHDKIYKGDPKIKNSAEVKKYTRDLSNHLHNLDKGGHDDPEQRPEEPKILKDAGIVFDWSQVHAEREKAPETKDLKHYVVIRDKDKVNKEVKEFDSFEDANAHAEKLRSAGHEGELPVGYARDKSTFLFTFNEYRPKGKVK